MGRLWNGIPGEPSGLYALRWFCAVGVVGTVVVVAIAVAVRIVRVVF